MCNPSLTQKVILNPFLSENTAENFQISVLLSYNKKSLHFDFQLTGKIDDLAISTFEPAKAQRKDRLWEHTCFEIFLGKHGMPDYLEFNLSPSGDWNVYSFSGYREGMRPAVCFDTLPFEIKILPVQTLKLKAAIDLKVLKDYSDIDVGLSAILEQKDGIKSYWAVSHPGDIPDFHSKEGWLKSF